MMSISRRGFAPQRGAHETKRRADNALRFFFCHLARVRLFCHPERRRPESRDPGSLGSNILANARLEKDRGPSTRAALAQDDTRKGARRGVTSGLRAGDGAEVLRFAQGRSDDTRKKILEGACFAPGHSKRKPRKAEDQTAVRVREVSLPCDCACGASGVCACAPGSGPCGACARVYDCAGCAGGRLDSSIHLTGIAV